MMEPPKSPPRQASDLSKEERSTLRSGKAAEEFLASDFGKFYVKTLQAHIDVERRKIDNPINPSAGEHPLAYVLRAEASKGAIMGLRLASEILSGMVESAKQVRVVRGLGTAGEFE